MWWWALVVAAGFGAEPAVSDLAQLGHSRYERAEFKGAAQAFTRALKKQPEDPDLHRWLGKSYEKLAEVDNPLLAPRDAAKAEVSLERAVELAPSNHEVLRELFDFYLASPQWIAGGLAKAGALVERLEPANAAAQAFLRKLIEGARQESRGLYGRLRQATMIPAAGVSRVLR